MATPDIQALQGQILVHRAQIHRLVGKGVSDSYICSTCALSYLDHKNNDVKGCKRAVADRLNEPGKENELKTALEMQVKQLQTTVAILENSIDFDKGLETAQRKLEFRSRLYALAVKRLGAVRAAYNEQKSTIQNASDYHDNWINGSMDDDAYKAAIRQVFSDADDPLDAADITDPDVGSDPSMLSDDPRATFMKHPGTPAPGAAAAGGFTFPAATSSFPSATGGATSGTSGSLTLPHGLPTPAASSGGPTGVPTAPPPGGPTAPSSGGHAGPPSGGSVPPPGGAAGGGGGGGPPPPPPPYSGSMSASPLPSPPRLFELDPCLYFLVHCINGPLAGGEPENGIEKIEKARVQNKITFDPKDTALSFLEKRRKLMNLFVFKYPSQNMYSYISIFHSATDGSLEKVVEEMCRKKSFYTSFENFLSIFGHRAYPNLRSAAHLKFLSLHQAKDMPMSTYLLEFKDLLAILEFRERDYIWQFLKGFKDQRMRQTVEDRHWAGDEWNLDNIASVAGEIEQRKEEHSAMDLTRADPVTVEKKVLNLSPSVGAVSGKSPANPANPHQTNDGQNLSKNQQKKQKKQAVKAIKDAESTLASLSVSSFGQNNDRGGGNSRGNGRGDGNSRGNGRDGGGKSRGGGQGGNNQGSTQNQQNQQWQQNDQNQQQASTRGGGGGFRGGRGNGRGGHNNSSHSNESGNNAPMMPMGPVLPRYQNIDIKAMFNTWLQKMSVVNLQGICFGCLQPGHGWSKDFRSCALGKCAICQVSFSDQQKGHASADCPCFPTNMEDLNDIRKIQGTF